MYTIACARVALECDASTDVEVGDVVTVRRVESTDDGETLAFAQRCRMWDLDKFSSLFKDVDEHFDLELMRQESQGTVGLMLALLGLNGAADTVIGDETVKGVSGGEKRRVTLGEMLISRTQVMLLDEISTGLDSAATRDITRTLRTAARLFHSTTIVALLQPPSKKMWAVRSRDPQLAMLIPCPAYPTPLRCFASIIVLFFFLFSAWLYGTVLNKKNSSFPPSLFLSFDFNSILQK